MTKDLKTAPRVGLNFSEIGMALLYSIARTVGLFINRCCDRRLHIETSREGFEKRGRSFFEAGKFADGVLYTPVSYRALRKIGRHLRERERDVFVDLGCGKGRVICYYDTYRFKKMIGVELIKELADIARQNVGNLKVRNNPIEIVNADAVDVDLKEGTLFFLYNPFGIKTLSSVIAAIKDSLRTHPRKIRIIYVNPVHADLLNAQEWLETEEVINDFLCGTRIWRSVQT